MDLLPVNLIVPVHWVISATINNAIMQMNMHLLPYEKTF